MEKSIHIILSEVEDNFQGEEVGQINGEDLSWLEDLVIESESLNRNAEKFDAKKDKALRHANKLMRRIIVSHGIKYDPDKQAVGISEKDVIYIGEKERVMNNSSADPIDGDEIKGTITTQEKRKYGEMLETFKYLNERALEHNKQVIANENNLSRFEKQYLEGKEYSKDDDYLVVFSKTGKVVLCKK